MKGLILIRLHNIKYDIAIILHRFHLYGNNVHDCI